MRIAVRPIILKGKRCFQAEKYTSTQVFHENFAAEELSEWTENNLAGAYKQICVRFGSQNITYLFSSKQRSTRLVKADSGPSDVVLATGNNRKKKYIINEGDAIPALVDLGIFTAEYKVVNSKYDKFKQINRFLEILNENLSAINKKDITLLDFGCGKSYLTFVIYHYLVNILGLHAKIIGYDLKSDVVQNCSCLAAKYGYSDLHFYVADVTKDALTDENIDVVLSLHACDIATDYALYYAVTHNVPYIFSVPCCQHEINQTILSGDGDIDVLMKYGIVKERVSALLTDTIRAMLLEDNGYKVDVMEFVDLAHSPKKLMIRARKTSGKLRQSQNHSETIRQLMSRYCFKQTLYELLCTE